MTIIIQMLKNIIINLLKMGLAGGLIYWLVQSGKLDFSLLNELIRTPSIIIMSLLFLQVVNGLITIRLRLLIEHRSKTGLPFFNLFCSSWIGLFFNSVLPGSVSGDLVKIFYIQKIDGSLSKKFLLLAVLIDRVIGLSGLIIVGGIASIVNYKTLAGLSPDVLILTQINIFLMICILGGFSLIYIAPKLPLIISGKLKGISRLQGILKKLEGLWIEFTNLKKKLLIQLGISMLIQALAIFIFWYITSPFAHGEFTLVSAFSIMPIGFISIALPIAPAGLGVGHVIFERLLSYFSVANGASLFNLYFFIVIGSNLTGVIPYVFMNNKKEFKKELS